MAIQELPTWDSCKSRHERKLRLNGLEQFIFDYEPVVEAEAREFRKDLLALVNYLRPEQPEC